MANHVLQTILQLRYDTYANWINSSYILNAGEGGLAYFPNDNPSDPPKAVGMKIGDGRHYFSELPWIQGIAPSMDGGSSGITISTPRIYQLVKDNNDNKYYLQHQDEGSNQWIVDTEHFVDLTQINEIINWLGDDYYNYFTIYGCVNEYVRLALQKVKASIPYKEGQVIVGISQTNGIISADQRQVSLNSFSGVLNVNAGGTGIDSINEDEILVGSNNNEFTTRTIESTLTNNNNLATNRAIKNYVDQQTAGLSGAMHFIGVATVKITENSNTDPRVLLSNNTYYNFMNALPGDVVIYEQQEFVWSGSYWILLGDGSLYALKGQIVDADIHADATIQQTKIANLVQDLESKVDKENNKGLSSNDFTTELKIKLDGIEDGANRNVIEHIFGSSGEKTPGVIQQLPNSIQIKEFTDDAADKLNSIQTGAQINTIEQIFINGTEWKPQDKQVKITIDQTALDLKVLEGAFVLDENNEPVEISQVNKKLQLPRIAMTGDVKDLQQMNNTVIIFDCGTSDNDTHIVT